MSAVTWLLSHPWMTALFSAVSYLAVIAFVAAFIAGSNQKPVNGTIPEWVAEDSPIRSLPEPLNVGAMVICATVDPTWIDALISDIFS
jgi:hypothetical protein